MKPKMFIGSSVESLPIAYAAQQNLRYCAEVTVWDQGVFELSASTLDSLIKTLEKSDFAMFVFSPDDLAQIRGEQSSIVRDNVLLELGLFVGRLGKSRCFILAPDNPTALRIPTDLIGMTPARYETNRSDNSYQAATGPACNQIRQQIEAQGFLQIEETQATPKPPVDKDKVEAGFGPDQTRTIEEKKDSQSITLKSWIESYVRDDFVETARLLELELTQAEEKDKLSIEAFLARVIYKFDRPKGQQQLDDLISRHPDSHTGYFQYALAASDIGLAEEKEGWILENIGNALTNRDFLTCAPPHGPG